MAVTNFAQKILETPLPSHESFGSYQLNQEAYFRLLADGLPEMLWTADSNGAVDWTNKQWREYTGLSIEDTAGEGWRKAIHPDDHERTAAAWQKAYETGAPYEIVYRWLSKDGESRWFLGRAVPVRDDSGQIIKWFGSITDINEAKVNEQTLELRVNERTALIETTAGILSRFVESGDFRESSGELLKLAMAQTNSEYGFIGATIPGGPDGVILRVFAHQGFNWHTEDNREFYEKAMNHYDAEGYIDFTNLKNLFGAAILGRTTIVANAPKDDPRSSGRIPSGHPPLQSFLGVPIFKGESVVGMFGLANSPTRYSDANAHAVSLLAQTASVIYENYGRQQREGMLIAERIKAEEKLKVSNQSLLDLAYVVSHELQEPLRIIRSELTLLQARYSHRLGSDADRFIENSHRASDVVNRMIDDLWEYARIERPHIQFETIDLNDILQKVLSDLEPVIQRTQTSIESERLPVSTGEPRQFFMLFRQLILNGIIHSIRPPEIEITTSTEGAETVICFKDNGIGFEPSESSEVFKMFKKLNRDVDGTGMGLAIAKRIVQFYGGRIWAESVKGIGSKFFVALPKVTSPDSQRPQDNDTH